MNRITQREERAAADSAREQSEVRILRMTPDGKTASSIEAVLHQRLEGIAQSIREKDADQLVTFYAPDVVAFDVQPPLDTRGVAEYRKNFERWFASFEGPISFELKNLRVVPGEFTAFSHYLALVVGAIADGQKIGYWVRGTTCFERRDGQWLVSHEHISMPSPM